MVEFQAEIIRSETQGAAMVGWAYIDVPQGIADRLKPGYRQVYRVRGEIDGHPFSGLSLMPKGAGDYILAINSGMRKVLEKGVGDTLSLRLEEDHEFVIEIPEDLEICLLDDAEDLLGRFMGLPKSHRNYFINHINGAKTEPTRTKRIAMTVEAMAMGLDFGAMIRLDKARRRNE
ncbi:YdeI/OmpD-associated family protein [Parapedobacter koreensis]|uniref:Bacteriocin-protection, YdeI or OmpD-Associated n=1 Tax=Parapedobacter koreensis TaxID=332977 RepID=A0A1H7M813_9SPHI|nr:YdeI/OmpD-associated family protein [Parapedobacter koreensis]SEL07406.1 Bacteriocin-protection, YdeI or OmpD-Associated [Parapedobacter koreensis]